MIIMLISLVYLLTLGMTMIASDNVAVMLLFVSAGILLGKAYLTREPDELDEPLGPIGQALMQQNDSSDLADAVSHHKVRQQIITSYVMPPHPHCPRCHFSGYDPARPCNACGYHGEQ
ncbi:MAG: hypothetical protein WC455_25420 [Dehalococcoidia bacterium]